MGPPNGEHVNGGNTNLLPQIHEALNLVHGPYSSNESRRQAGIFLEDLKRNDEAPYHGFNLASDKTQQPVVRHYALSLLEFALRYKWAEYSEEQADTLRRWVLQLSQNVSQEDPQYLRNKTAQLWVEIAKRSWAATWLDMDELLVQLWNIPGQVVHKEFVLFVLETLSEEVFNGEDTVAIMREGVLSKACVEIFTPAIVLAEAFPNRQIENTVRYGEEGWLVRLGELLSQCLNTDLYNNSQYQNCAVRALAVYKSVMPWAIPRAINSASCVHHMCKSLAASSVAVQLASVEALHSLYCRMNFSDEEFLTLVCPMYKGEMVELLQKLYDWSVVDANNVDDEKYLFAKKFSEMISNLGSLIEQKNSAIPEDCDLPNLLNLFLAITQSQSFVVSIPLLVTWTRLLRSETIGGSPTMSPLIAPLLELCSSRLIRYDSMPDDTDDPSFVLLLEDIDTIPERHAFLGNYRRYSTTIIELIVRQKQSEAIYHILGQIDNSLQHLYDGQPSFNSEKYSKTSVPVLRVDAHFTVVEAALKGYMKWRSVHGSKLREDDQQRVSIENNLETWCERLLALNFEDPLIRKRVLQLAVAFSTSALDKKAGFMLKVLEHILMSQPVEHPEHAAYSEAVKELQVDGTYELQILASKMPDQLLDVYEQIEAKVKEIIASGKLDSKRQVSYQTFLFTIIHRAANVTPEVRLQKLQGFIDPVQQLWLNPALETSISTFPGFCDLLGLNKVQQYLTSHRVHEIQNWAQYTLDPEGQAIQAELEERLKALPLRTTKSFLACSTEKVEKDSEAYRVSRMLWRERLPVILPNLLQFLNHSHAFHNPSNWAGLPPEMQGLVSRILTDRFWQAGISEGTKDDFYARVSGTKTTMEGFASSIRGSVRTVREACYSILWCMSRLDVDFYGFSQLPGPLANSLFADAHCLSSHQLIALLNVVRLMVDDCPVEVRSHFVPPILAACFTQMDAKISSEWEKLAQRQVIQSESESLTDEMKEESILRQLTHAAVMMIGGFLDPARPNPQAVPITNKEASTYVADSNPASSYPSMRKFCLTSSTILEPLLLFLAHAIRMRDSRCCGVVLRVYRSIIPDFTATTGNVAFSQSIREFISEEVLKSCIASLNETYFVDLHKELAQTIAAILTCYSPLTNTPRNILLSLPNIQEKAVDKTLEYITRPNVPQRQQRGAILDLLKDLKGVSISEQGRITKSVASVRKERSKMQQEFLKEAPRNEPRGPSPSLEGVAGMFEER
ncbi:ARM repeat-containing protein [Glarea lozoyensis ATCC 20868]|uniref:ARM repeat-containing protein n=1 Tax=Glarea lozoyensis (strain ATCC 20868 / MF5171) TaxID=1116229 RepID=S3DQY1_GLAL2|nr:ARM repeat-containing protein [Glarea lozoyensis ATCC 20868]EPE34431.1 ARM repeat-containing protein [Glarea lozoyensis ATCC 20868]